MAKLIKPTEKWKTLPEIEKLYKKEKDIRLAKKLNAIRLLLKGNKRKDIALNLGVCEATIKNWRNAWNKAGVEGLKTKHRGSHSKVDEQMRADITEVVQIKRVINGQVITGTLIAGYLKKKYQITVSPSQVRYILRQMGFVRLTPRPLPLLNNQKKKESFKKTASLLSKEQGVDVWYCDESGIEKDAYPYKLWCAKGSKAQLYYTGSYLKENVIGAVRPADGRFVSLVMATVNTDSF